MADLPRIPVGARVSVTGSLRHPQLKRTVAGDDWAVVTVVQDEATITVMAFIGIFATIETEVLVPDALVKVTGCVHRTSGGTSQIAASELRSAAA